MATAVVALVTSYAAGTAATALALTGLAKAAFIAVASTLISNELTSAFGLNKQASSPSFTSEAKGRTQVVRSSVANRYVVYGQTIMSGPLVFAASSGDKNEFLHLVIPLATHEVEEIGDVYLGDKLVSYYDRFDKNKRVDITYNTGVYCSAVNYSATINGTTYTETTLTALSDAINADRTDVDTWIYRERLVIDGVTPNHNFSISASAYAHCDESSYNGPTYETDVEATIVVGANAYQAYRVNKHLGAADQAADSDLVAEIDEWTSDHRLQGVAYVYVRLQYDRDVFPNGIPNIRAVVKGKKVYDPRTGTTAWSDNWALCVRDYITSAHGLNASSDEINDASFIAAANTCDEIVSTPEGDQSRYTCNGAIELGNKPAEILAQLATAGAGAVIYVQGEYRIHAGAYSSPVASLDEDNLRAGLRVRPRLPRKDLFNAVRGTYLSAANDWQPADFPAVTNATYEAQDGDEQIFRDIELPFTDDSYAAQRIAKIHLEKSRQGITVDFPANLSALELAPYDVVELSIDRLGWANKEFRVVNWQLSQDGGVDLTLQEEASASYAWSSGEATTVDAAPDTNLPSPWDVAQPVALTISEELYTTTRGSGVKARATVAWESADALAVEHQLEYRGQGDADYTRMPRTSGTTQKIDDIRPGQYEFRVRSFSPIGVPSDFTEKEQEIFALAAPPTEPQNMTISSIGGLAIIRWDQSTDLDVLIGGKVVFRHSKATTGATWQSSVSIGEAIPGSANFAALPLKSGTYLAKAVDASGIGSTDFASVTTKQATALDYTNVDTVAEHTSFPGAKTDVVAIDGKLQLTGVNTMDQWTANVDALANWDTGDGSVNTSGTYLFDGGFDFGSVVNRRLTTDIDVLVKNVDDLIDSRTSNIDNWESFDGTASAAGDVKIFARHTDDDPAGTPTWSAWERLDSAEFNTRAFEFKAEMSTNDSAYNIEVSEMTVNADRVT